MSVTDREAIARPECLNRMHYEQRCGVCANCRSVTREYHYDGDTVTDNIGDVRFRVVSLEPMRTGEQVAAFVVEALNGGLLPTIGNEAAVRADERERCAKIAENQNADDWFEVGKVVVATGKRIASAIRSASLPPQAPDGVETGLREALEPLRTLLEKSEGSWPKIPWKVVPCDRKPIIASDRGGNLFRGYIATWQEADLIVGVVNALPAIFAALSTPTPEQGDAA